MLVLAIAFVGLLALSVPIAFAMGLAAAATISTTSTPMLIVVQRMVGGMDSFVLLAVPLFILAGALMEAGSISLRLVNLAKTLVGWVRGGLAMAVVVGEIFFSGISGSTAADVSAIGSLLIPSMVRAGYKPAEAVSVVSAASAMGILVPPCILMIIVSAITSTSVAALFVAGFIPAFVLAACLVILIYLQARRQGFLPDHPPSLGRVARSFLDALIPLGMPIIIFGGILGGIVTATEAAVLAVAYAFVVGVFVYRDLTAARIGKALTDTVVATGTVSLLLGTATIFAWIMATQRVPQMLTAFFGEWTAAPWLFLVAVAIIFALFGSVLEGLPAVVLLLPSLLPVANMLKVNTLHFGIIVITAVGIGLFLPPIGVGLLIASGLGRISATSAARSMMPYLAVLAIGTLILILVPWFTLVLPAAFGMIR